MPSMPQPAAAAASAKDKDSGRLATEAADPATGKSQLECTTPAAGAEQGGCGTLDRQGGCALQSVEGQLGMASSQPPETSSPASPGAVQPEGMAEGGAEGQPAGDAAPKPKMEVPPYLSHYPQELLRLTALIRSSLGLQRGQQGNLRMVMKTALLAGQEVRFQNKLGKVLNTGEPRMHFALQNLDPQRGQLCWDSSELKYRYIC